MTLCLNVGWIKLRKYYQKTDLTPAYIMAVFLQIRLVRRALGLRLYDSS
jgi:hypothetical protein